MMLISDATEDKGMETTILRRREEDLELQLKAVRMLIERDREATRIDREPLAKTDVCGVITQENGNIENSGKAEKLKLILQSMFREVMEEYQEEMCEELTAAMKKEMDYQFRIMQEHQEEVMKSQQQNMGELELVKRKKEDNVHNHKDDQERRDSLRKRYTLFS